MISLGPPDWRKITIPAKHLKWSVRSVVRHAPVVTPDTHRLGPGQQGGFVVVGDRLVGIADAQSGGGSPGRPFA
jgi:hypothetical protein